MARGRKPKPIELRDAEGNRGRRPLPVPVKTDPLTLEPPAMLQEQGAQLWREMVEQLGGAGALASIDRVVLTTFCLQWDQLMAANAVEREQSQFAKGSMGQLVEHPALKIQARAANLLLKFAAELAATPVARARIATAQSARRQQDEFEQIVGAEVEDAEIDPDAL